MLLHQVGRGTGAAVRLLQKAGERAGRRAGRQAGRLTGQSEQVLLLVAASAGPRKEPGRHWVQAWWEEGPTSLPWPQAVQVALAVKALRNLPLSQAAQESGPSAVELAGTKPPLQGVQAAMPARGANVLSVHALHVFSSSATPLGVRVLPVQKDTVPLGHRSISVRAAAPPLVFSL